MTAIIEAAARALEMDEETAAFMKLLRHYAKLLGGEMPGVMNKAADMIEAARHDLAYVRAAALEEAAQVAEEYDCYTYEDGPEIAAAIRALKEQP